MSRDDLVRLAHALSYPPLVYCGRPLSPAEWRASAFPDLVERLRLAAALERIARTPPESAP